LERERDVEVFFKKNSKNHNLSRKIEVVLEYSGIDIIFSKIFKIN
jgi:hypothetical protein